MDYIDITILFYYNYFSGRSKNGFYFSQRIHQLESTLKIARDPNLIDNEISSLRRTLYQLNEEIGENKSDSYWALGMFTALDIILAVTLKNLG